MPEFSVINRSEAPKPLRQSGKLAARMREYEAFVQGVSKSQAGKLVPAQGESARGVALRVSRAAKRLNKGIQTWVADGAVYFKLD